MVHNHAPVKPEWSEFADRLRHAMRGYSQRAFCDKANLDRSALNQWLAGETKPSMGALESIVAATGCNPGWLLTGEGEPFPQPDPGLPDRLESVDTARRELAAAMRTLARAAAALVPLLDEAAAEDLRTAAGEVIAAIASATPGSATSRAGKPARRRPRGGKSGP